MENYFSLSFSSVEMINMLKIPTNYADALKNYVAENFWLTCIYLLGVTFIYSGRQS